jgi:hypothetical protein
VQLTPGATISGWNTIKVNGNPTGTFRILFEGQESSSGLDARVSDESQPSVEAIQEFTLQTSNFAAEFGLVAGGLFNFTSRGGTNEFHGSAYDYITNEALNAGVPFTNNGRNGHNRIQSRLHDFGFSAGGPVILPKLYNGKNKTFFFWNYEKYRDKHQAYFAPQTLPTDQLRSGDLSPMLNISGEINRNIGTDPFGRAIIQNQIYDPLNYTTVGDRRMLQLFPNNLIPGNRIDPVARKILDSLPKSTIAGQLVNNYQVTLPFQKIQQIPSVKIDHTFNEKSKISGYWSQQNTDKDVGQDGLPFPISRGRVLVIRSYTVRINYDYSLTPTTLLHMGAGVQRYRNPDSGPPAVTDYDAAGLLGIIGAPGTGYPRLGGLGNSTFGGMSGPTGAANRGLYLQVKPTGVIQVSHIRGSHTYKAGGEWKIDTFTNISEAGLAPALNFASTQTAQPLYGTINLPGGTSIGNGFASFLLGYFDSASIGNRSAPQYRRSGWGFFVQDTWKISRKLTLDYGMRYDLQKPERELWGRQASFRPDVNNPKVGKLGGIIYENQCHCTLATTYPYAVAPRIGIAYQIDPKTVLRAGWGLSYSTVNNFAYIGASPSTGFNTISFGATDTVNNGPAGKLSDGLKWNSADLYGAAYDQGFNAYIPGTGLQSAVGNVDPNGGRPPRVNQWNLSLQREVVRDLVVEAAYVGNRGVWFQNNALVNYNALDPVYLNSLFSRLGLNPTVAADRSLLTGTITSAAAVAKGFAKPYANFPDSGTVIQSLKPYPQYNGVGATWAPLGNSWYDALQVKATKRYSNGLDATVSYAYSKNLTNISSASGNIFDRSTFKGLSPDDRPHILTISINYALPAYGFVKQSRLARLALSGWTLGSVLQYQSGVLLASPTSSNSIGTYYPGQSSRQFRVAGQPLYLKDLNCGCIKPDVETVLNPAAWVDAPLGTFGAQQTYYGDFRGQRRPNESMAFGKRFSFGERSRKAFTIRAEFFNIFNRMVSLPDPVTTNPQTLPTRSGQGVLTGGFGFVNFNAIDSNNQNNAYPAPRTGQFVARIEF